MPVSVLCVHDRMELLAGMVELTISALWNSVGLETICSVIGAVVTGVTPAALVTSVAPLVFGRLTYQPKLPFVQAAVHCAHTIGVLLASTPPAPLTTANVCTCRLAVPSVKGELNPVRDSMLAAVRLAYWAVEIEFQPVRFQSQTA